MSRRASIVALCLAPLLSGCGGGHDHSSATPARQSQVRELLPGARDIRCAPDRRDHASCTATVGAKAYRCELTYTRRPGRPEAYSGTSSCWTPP